MKDTTIPRTAAATMAAAESALQRRLAEAATLLRENGWAPNPPTVSGPVFNEAGQCVRPGRETTYRCPADGKESWHVASAGRFYHCDGSQSRSCHQAISRGKTMWPLPVIDQARP